MELNISLERAEREKLDALDKDNFCDLRNKEKGNEISRKKRVLIEESSFFEVSCSSMLLCC